MSGRGRDSRGGNGKGSFNFPQWNYGYTIGPASQATAGDYSQFFVAQPGQAPIVGGPGGPRGGGGAPRGSPMRGGSGRSSGQVKFRFSRKFQDSNSTPEISHFGAKLIFHHDFKC